MTTVFLFLWKRWRTLAHKMRLWKSEDTAERWRYKIIFRTHEVRCNPPAPSRRNRQFSTQDDDGVAADAHVRDFLTHFFCTDDEATRPTALESLFNGHFLSGLGHAVLHHP